MAQIKADSSSHHILLDALQRCADEHGLVINSLKVDWIATGSISGREYAITTISVQDAEVIHPYRT